MNTLCHRFMLHARRASIRAALPALFCFSALPALAGPVDLSTWTAQHYSPGAGNWVLQPGNTSVLQTLNGAPTVFLSNQSALGTDIQGNVRVTTTSDDDFIGFVLGFSAGDFSNAAADYLLIDWKQSSQSGAAVGLAVSQVTGTGGDFWTHTNGVTELARGATLGSTGWVDNVGYTFGFTFTPTNLQVSVNGVQQFNIAGNFSDGNFGFYNASQSNVLYSGFTQDTIPGGVPDSGTTAGLLGVGLLGLVALSRRRLANA
jgi:hypothetical protein